jgi:hypothetical protein
MNTGSKGWESVMHEGHSFTLFTDYKPMVGGVGGGRGFILPKGHRETRGVVYFCHIFDGELNKT